MPGPLATWIQPLPLERLEDRLLGEAVFLPPDPARLAVLGDLASASVDDWLADPHSDVVAWFSRQDGIHQTARVSHEAGRRLHGAGIALYLLNVPALDALSDQVAAELGVPARNAQCTLFCNPAGSLTRMHFDPVHNFTVQLSGRKRWTVARNQHVSDPTMGWAMLDKTVPSELGLHCHEQLPTALPADARELTLTAGALLSIPRGWWHGTASDEPSISLHLHYEPILWADTVLATLRARLLREARWRAALPLPVSGPPVDADAYLAHLAAAVRDLTPPDLIPGDGDRAGGAPLTRTAGGSLAVVGPLDGEEAVEIEVTAPQPGGHRRTQLALAPAPLAAARRLASTTPARPLRAAQLVEEVPTLTADDAGALVDALLDAGFLRPAELASTAT